MVALPALLLLLLLLLSPLQEAVRMDHLEVVKLMEGKGGKVWEDGQVRAAAVAAAAQQQQTAAAPAAGAAHCRVTNGVAEPAIAVAADA
jgi:hypothetical protein